MSEGARNRESPNSQVPIHLTQIRKLRKPGVGLIGEWASKKQLGREHVKTRQARMRGPTELT
eukprot:8661176-Alexandrium_andersonii.AAC.1